MGHIREGSGALTHHRWCVRSWIRPYSGVASSLRLGPPRPKPPYPIGGASGRSARRCGRSDDRAIGTSTWRPRRPATLQPSIYHPEQAWDGMQPVGVDEPRGDRKIAPGRERERERDPWIAVAAAGVRLGTPPFGWFGGLALRGKALHGKQAPCRPSVARCAAHPRCRDPRWFREHLTPSGRAEAGRVFQAGRVSSLMRRTGGSRSRTSPSRNQRAGASAPTSPLRRAGDGRHPADRRDICRQRYRWTQRPRAAAAAPS